MLSLYRLEDKSFLVSWNIGLSRSITEGVRQLDVDQTSDALLARELPAITYDG